MVPMPTNPEIHIQKSAPGPPAVIAVATPAMLPLPTIPPTAVARAPSGEMSPSSLSRARRARAHRAAGNSRTGSAARRMKR